MICKLPDDDPENHVDNFHRSKSIEKTFLAKERDPNEQKYI